MESTLRIIRHKGDLQGHVIWKDMEFQGPTKDETFCTADSPYRIMTNVNRVRHGLATDPLALFNLWSSRGGGFDWYFIDCQEVKIGQQYFFGPKKEVIGC